VCITASSAPPIQVGVALVDHMVMESLDPLVVGEGLVRSVDAAQIAAADSQNSSAGPSER
jgi:hypothetical protein